MNFKKGVFAAIVVSLAFSLGYVTYKGAELVKTLVIGSDSECTQSYERGCASQEFTY